MSHINYCLSHFQMQALFSNSGFNSNALMTQGLTDVLTKGFNFDDLSFGLLNTKPFKKPDNSPALTSETRSSNLPLPTLVSSTGYPQFPFIEKSPEPSLNGDSKHVKEKLLAALKEIIPHKTSLNLRMLVTYTVDNSSSDVIVIDETLSRKDSEAVSGNVLDLSQKGEETPQSSNPENESADTQQQPTMPAMGLVSDSSAPLGLIQPADAQAPALNTEAALIMLQTLLSSSNSINNANANQFGSFNFPLPLNFTPLQQIDLKSQLFPSDIAPNITITNCENILPNLQFGATLEASVPATNESGSRSSSPLSNHERSSPSSTVKPIPRVPSQVTATSTFSRRYVHPRRFICNQCRQQFTSLAELNRHTMELHTSFRCNFCKAKFTQRSNLQRHSLKHVGFKPFTCNICQKEYYRKDHLVRHIEVTHPNVDPRANITTRLTSSECLEFLDNLHIYGNAEGPMEETTTPSPQNENSIESKYSPLKLEEDSTPTLTIAAPDEKDETEVPFEAPESASAATNQPQPMET